MNDNSIATEFRGYISRVDALIDVDRWSEARGLLLEALRLAPEDTGALCRLSLVQYHLGEHYEALDWADRAIAADPECDWACRLRSLALSAVGNDRDAVKAAREAVRLAPQGREALYLLSSAQRKYGLVKDAKVTAHDLLAVAPEWINTFEALTLVALAERKWKEAEEYGRRGLEIDPNSYSMLNNIGVALLEQKRKREAVECFEAAARVQPDRPVARKNLKVAVDRYLKLTPIVFVLGWISLHAANVDSRVSLFGLGAVGVGVLVARWYKRRQLSDTVRTFMRLETQDYRRPRWWLELGEVLLPLVIVVAVIGFYANWMDDFLTDHAGAWYTWIVFLLVTVVSLGAIGWAVWKVFRNRREA